MGYGQLLCLLLLILPLILSLFSADIAKVSGFWMSLRNAMVFTRNHLFCVFGVGKQGVACVQRAERAVELATAHFLLVRNLCAHVQPNQKDAWERGLYEPTEEILSYLCSWLTSTKDCCFMMKDKVTKCVNVGTQVLANMMTGYPEIQDKLWPRYFKDSDLLNQLVSTVQCQNMTYVLVCIYNCTHRCRDRCLYMTQTHHGRAMLRALLEKAGEMLCREKDACPAFDFINMVELELTPAIMQAMCHGKDPNRQHVLVPCHITFLQLLDGMIDAQHNRETDAVERVQVQIGIDTTLFLVILAKRVVNNMTRVAGQHSGGGLNSEAVGSLFGCDVTGLVLILQYLARVTPELGPDAKMKLMKADIGETLLAILRLVNELQPRITLTTQKASEVEVPGFFMLKCDVIRVLANLAYDAKEVQDEFGRIGALPAVLNECNVDESQPFIKEQSLLAIRNLCDGNIKNQAYLASLEPRGIAPESQAALEDLGLAARLDQGGRIKISATETCPEPIANENGLKIQEVEL
ncbi:spinocerebellar ataxia type 10 protein domain-containing protein [Gaertneriomyces semiglobifer]|nr:spinocerebellar ataxia type 10 protein domain-containing protein [Gaertneriomyces semiglobifer]